MTQYALNLKEFEMYRQEGFKVIDLRHPIDFADGFIPGSYNIYLNQDFKNHAPFFIFKDQGILLICDRGLEKDSISRLEALKYNNIKGYLLGGIETWTNTGHDLDVVISIDAEELDLEIRFGQIDLFDLRKADLFIEKHLKNSENIDFDVLMGNTDLINRESINCFFCKDGVISMSVISFLKELNIHNSYHVKGGFDEISINDCFDFE